jgi:carboxyl-terminal processing protease
VKASRVALVAALYASTLTAPVAAQGGSYEDLQRFTAVLNHIRQNYVDSVSYRSLVRAAIDGMLRALDPHSWFIGVEDNKRLDALARGELAVTGVAVELADGVPTVLSVRDGSPADGAGVRPGDRILSVDGQPVSGLNSRVIALRLAGEKGSKVRVLLERGPRLEPDSVSVTMKRAPSPPATSVTLSRMLDGTTGYLRLHEFGATAAKEITDSISRLKARKATRFILDLRGNPGGIVTEAVSIASTFLPESTVVFSTRGRQRSVNQVYRTKGGGEYRDLPLVVLIDQGSASAAEALAGSLQDHDRAVIAGRRSFGKALMQTGFSVPDGYVQLTIGQVVSPSGRFIQRPYRGLAIEQYYAFAGDSSWQDTSSTFKSDHGRVVHGGGGVAPDVALPSPPAIPRWFTVASDSGWDRAVADSVGFTLATGEAARLAWQEAGAATWADRLLPPLLARVHGRLGLSVQPDDATRAAMARRLAAMAAKVRWGAAAAEEFTVNADPDIIAARALFARAPAILGGH